MSPRILEYTEAQCEHPEDKERERHGRYDRPPVVRKRVDKYRPTRRQKCGVAACLRGVGCGAQEILCRGVF